MQIKILTFNIHKGLNVIQSKLTLFDIRDLLHEIDADIVFLQEVQGEHKRNQKKFKDWPNETQSQFLAGDKWPFHFYGKNHSHKHGHHGNAILSKFPLNNSSNLDITASRFSNRGLLYARIDHFSKPIHLMCTHLGLLKRERKKQFNLLNQFMTQNIVLSEPLLMAGDFNDWQMSATDLLSENLKLKEVFVEMHGKAATSYPAELPLLKVDRIYFRGIEPMSCKTINVKGISDHLPLVAEFDLSSLVEL